MDEHLVGAAFKVEDVLQRDLLAVLPAADAVAGVGDPVEQQEAVDDVVDLLRGRGLGDEADGPIGERIGHAIRMTGDENDF